MSVPLLDVFVPGLPRPAGSKRVFMVGLKDGPKRPIITDDVNTKGPGGDWRAVVQLAVARAYRDRPTGGVPLCGPLELALHFVVPRPQGHFGKRGLRTTAPPFPDRKPDLGKYERAIEDALSRLVWVDDAQIVTKHTTKRYGDPIGVHIVVAVPAFVPAAGITQQLPLASS